MALRVTAGRRAPGPPPATPATGPPGRVTVENLTVAYDRNGEPVPIVRHLSLDIEPGSLVSIVGPSGCGKSTLLHATAGLPPAFSHARGDIRVDGRRDTGPGPDRMVVFQQYTLFPWLTVRGNIGYGLKVARTPRGERDQRVDDILTITGLVDSADAYPHQISGGMQQRVALARALVVDPTVLLMDEPFAAVDALTRRTLQSELMRIWELRRKTILLVTHNVDEALLLGSRVIVMAGKWPAHIALDTTVDLPRPRVLSEIHAHPRYIELERTINELLGVE